VLVPLIQDADDARAAVQACRYPPQGIRGVSPRRASNYFRDIQPYLAEANQSILLMVQIESWQAYEQLDAILNVDGIDCLLVGRVDLSASMNHMWDPSHPEVVQTVEDIIRRCRQAGRSAAVAAATDVEQIRYWLNAGANVLSFGSDLSYMQAGFQAFKAAMRQANLPL
jgi:4-hydroxy-2-oxoheptanedioate aldolase